MTTKVLFAAALLAMPTGAAMAQVVSTTPKTLRSGLGPIPAGMTNGTVYLTNYVDNNIEIYDATLTKVKEIAVPTITCPDDYKINKEREKVYVLDEENSESELAVYNFDADGNRVGVAVETLDQVKRTLSSRYDSIYVDAQGNTLLLSNESYDYADKDNKRYPRHYFLWETATKYLWYYDCSYNESYTGEWIEHAPEGSYSGDAKDMVISGALTPWPLDMTNGYDYDFAVNASQRLFNMDDAFEYLQPVVGAPEVRRVYKYDRDGDGEVDDIHTYYFSPVTAINIVSETGRVLQTLKLDHSMDASWLNEGNSHIAKIGDTYYLVCEWGGNGKDIESYSDFYAIDPTTSSVKRVGASIKTRVRPAIAERSQTITVETEAGNAPRTVTVSNAAGQTVWKQTIPAGQTSVQVDAARLSSGVNIVSVSGEDKKSGNCKIIVK